MKTTKPRRYGPLHLTKAERRMEIGNLLFEAPKRGFFVNRGDLLVGYQGRKRGLALANPFKTGILEDAKTDAGKGWRWRSIFKLRR